MARSSGRMRMRGRSRSSEPSPAASVPVASPRATPLPASASSASPAREEAQADVEIEIDERHGTTLEEIAAYMRDKLIDLVVIGPHTRKGLIKVLQASVTEKLMKDIACPMLVLPARA